MYEIIFAWKASGLNPLWFVHKMWATTTHTAADFFEYEGIDCGSLKVFSNLCSLFSFGFLSASSLLFELIYVCVCKAVS